MALFQGLFLYCDAAVKPETARTLIMKYWHLYSTPLTDCLLFRNDKDKKYFLNRLALCLLAHNIKIYAYCLMDNHIHLLISGEEADIDSFFLDLKRAYGKYVAQDTTAGEVDLSKFNQSKRVITGEEDFKGVVAYILRNPGAAGISSPFAYKWSSAFLYFNPWLSLFSGVTLKEYGKGKALKEFGTRIDIPDSYTIIDGVLNPVCWCDYRKVEQLFSRSQDLFKLLGKWGVEDEEDAKMVKAELNGYTDTELRAKVQDFCSIHGVSKVSELNAGEIRNLVSTASLRWKASRKQLERVLGKEAVILGRKY